MVARRSAALDYEPGLSQIQGSRGLPVVRGDEQVVAAQELPLTGGEPALGACSEILGVVCRARDAGDRQGAALPEVVVVDFRDSCAEAVAQVVLRGAHEVALPLQRSRLGKMELRRQDRDVTRGHGGLRGRGGGAARRLVQRRALDLTRLEHLEDVAFAEVIEPLEQDAALEAVGHLTHVVLEASQC
jgi:hypothetical protein